MAPSPVRHLSLYEHWLRPSVLLSVSPALTTTSSRVARPPAGCHDDRDVMVVMATDDHVTTTSAFPLGCGAADAARGDSIKWTPKTDSDEWKRALIVVRAVYHADAVHRRLTVMYLRPLKLRAMCRPLLSNGF